MCARGKDFFGSFTFKQIEHTTAPAGSLAVGEGGEAKVQDFKIISLLRLAGG